MIDRHGTVDEELSVYQAARRVLNRARVASLSRANGGHRERDMDTSQRSVIYTAAPVRVDRILDALQAAGLHPETADSPNVALPWVTSGQSRVSIVVPAPEVEEAKRVVDVLESELRVEASRNAARVGPSLLLVGVLAVAGAVASLVSTPGVCGLRLAGISCWIAGVVVVVRLVRRGRLETNPQA